MLSSCRNPENCNYPQTATNYIRCHDKVILMLSRDEREIKHLKAKIARKDAVITQLEAENDALGAKLHEQYTDKMHGKYNSSGEATTLKDQFWRRYVNGGSRIWRVLFEVCDSGGRLWRAMRQVAVKKHE